MEKNSFLGVVQDITSDEKFNLAGVGFLGVVRVRG